jgi:hypothetical protein
MAINTRQLIVTAPGTPSVAIFASPESLALYVTPHVPIILCLPPSTHTCRFWLAMYRPRTRSIDCVRWCPRLIQMK